MTKTTKIILTASVLVNILFVGALVGHALHRGTRAPDVRFAGSFMDRNASTRNEMNAERVKLFELMGSENFDRAAFDAQLQKVSAMQDKAFTNFANGMADKFQKMPADQRADAVKRITERLGNPGPQRIGRK